MESNRAGYFRVYGISGAIVLGLWAYAVLQGSNNDVRVLHPGPDSKLRFMHQDAEEKVDLPTMEFVKLSDLAK